MHGRPELRYAGRPLREILVVTQREGFVTQWKWARAGARNETTGFVGRAAELEAVRRAVTQARVVTLTGLGGVGRPGWRFGPHTSWQSTSRTASASRS